MASLGVSYDPQTTAVALAQKYTLPTQKVIDSQNALFNANESGLASLKSAMSTFKTALESLTGLGKSMYKQSAVLSDTTLGSATATSTAAPGTYSFFVEQVAAASQVAYNNVADVAVADGTGTLGIRLGASATPAFTADLSTADTDSNGTLTVREVAAAINKASGNAGQVSAAVVTVGGVQQLMLTAKNTGEASKISLDTSTLANADLEAALSNAANFKEVVAAKDAIAWIGPQTTGTRVQQASNTFSNIEGVKVTFTKAQASGASPVSVAVDTDTAGTTKNVQDFIDAYNKLKSAIDALVDAGDPEADKAGGPFAHDAGIRALRDNLVNLMRPAGSASLAAYGIIATKGGTLGLDSARLTRQLATDPTGLDALIGSTSASAPSGIADKLDKFIVKWTDTNGYIKKRQDEIDRAQKTLATRQDTLDRQYDSVYKRYLIQFTNLQAMQEQMNYSKTMFDALFGDDKS